MICETLQVKPQAETSFSSNQVDAKSFLQTSMEFYKRFCEA